MGIKSFNIDNELHKKYARRCKEKGISMSKQVENFIRKEIESMTSEAENVEIDTKKIASKLTSDIKSDHPLKKYCWCNLKVVITKKFIKIK